MGYYSEVGIGCTVSLDDAKRWYGRAAGKYSLDSLSIRCSIWLERWIWTNGGWWIQPIVIIPLRRDLTTSNVENPRSDASASREASRTTIAWWCRTSVPISFCGRDCDNSHRLPTGWWESRFICFFCSIPPFFLYGKPFLPAYSTHVAGFLCKSDWSIAVYTCCCYAIWLLFSGHFTTWFHFCFGVFFLADQRSCLLTIHTCSVLFFFTAYYYFWGIMFIDTNWLAGLDGSGMIWGRWIRDVSVLLLPTYTVYISEGVSAVLCT